jgi:hypothetical protein
MPSGQKSKPLTITYLSLKLRTRRPKKGVQITSDGSKNVTLKLTDSDGYSCPCQTIKNVSVGASLPNWREVSPQ